MHRPAPPNVSISCTSVAKARAFVYLLRCADGTLYCGWTVDGERRGAAPAGGPAFYRGWACGGGGRGAPRGGGGGSRYTASRLPVELAAAWELESARAAR